MCLTRFFFLNYYFLFVFYKNNNSKAKIIYFLKIKKPTTFLLIVKTKIYCFSNFFNISVILFDLVAVVELVEEEAAVEVVEVDGFGKNDGGLVVDVEGFGK